MAMCEILLFPEHEDALRKKSEPIHQVDEDVKIMIMDIKDTLGENPYGYGLSAPQINIHKRVVVIRLGLEGKENSESENIITLINPEIVTEGEECEDFDSCLSFLDLSGKTIRPHHLRVIGLDEHGELFDRMFNGFEAVVVHHAIDHLNGVLFIDRIVSLDDLFHFPIREDGELVRVPL